MEALTTPEDTKGKKVVIILAIALIVIAVATIGYFEYKEYKAEKRRQAIVESYKLKIQTDMKDKNPELFANLEKGRDANLEALAKDPNQGEVWVELGSIYESMGELDKAEEAYKKGVALTPINTVGWSNLAEVYKHQERFAEAKDAYLNLIKNVPTETTGYVKLADMYANGLEGGIEDAKKVLAEGVQRTKSESLNNLLQKLSTDGTF